MKQLTPLFIFCFIAFPFLHSCISNSSQQVKGNYEIVNEKIAIVDYEEIVLNLPATVFYRQISQDEAFLQLSVDKNILPYLNVFVKDKKLYINQKNDSILQPSQFVIYTNSKNLSKINLVGSGNIFMEREVNAENMEIAITGSGEVKTDSLFCENLKVAIKGSGKAVMQGAATQANFMITGSGNVDAFDYFVSYLDCIITGSGNANVYSGEKLKATIIGSGNINYKGNPATVSTEVRGSGRVLKIQ